MFSKWTSFELWAIHIWVICGLFIDFKKAFDTWDHVILTDKLCKMGIAEMENKWFLSYLMGRSQKVTTNGKTSTGLRLSPPPMFLVYINDLPQQVGIIRLQMYADDTVLYHMGDIPRWSMKNYKLL